jgi:WD40 repeat protein
MQPLPPSLCSRSPSGDQTLKVWDLQDWTLKVWDLETGKQVTTFTAGAPLRSCAVGPVEHVIVAGDGSGRVHFLSLELAEDN